jgi:hypothetical protein
MFCDGVCEHKSKRCGLYRDFTMKNEETQELKIVKECAIVAMMQSMFRQEQGQVRIQAAVESDRNESSKQLNNINDTLAKGAIGLLKAAQSSLALKENN